jgi:hypothetical protein
MDGELRSEVIGAEPSESPRQLAVAVEEESDFTFLILIAPLISLF